MVLGDSLRRGGGERSAGLAASPKGGWPISKRDDESGREGSKGRQRWRGIGVDLPLLTRRLGSKNALPAPAPRACSFGSNHRPAPAIQDGSCYLPSWILGLEGIGCSVR
jgi:hypothetical protein